MTRFFGTGIAWLGAAMVFVTATLGLATAHAATTTPTHSLRQAADLAAGTVPTSVPRDYVVTPMGYFPSECVHEIKHDEKLLKNARVQRADGSVWQEPSCQRPHYTREGLRVETTQQNASSDALHALHHKANPSSSGGYYAEVSYINGTTGTRTLSATWTVPAEPTRVRGQVVFIFPGLVEYDPEDTIMQPVLSWANFGENVWQFVSWNCCGSDSSGLVNYSTPINVSVGDSLYGLMSQNCPVGSSSCDSWNIVSQDVTTGQSSTLVTSDAGVTPTHGQVYNWIVGAALEAYGVTRCDEFPADGSIELSNIKAYDANNKLITPVWNATNALLINTPACNYSTYWDNTDNWIYY